MGIKTNAQMLKGEFGAIPKSAPSIGILNDGTELTLSREIDVVWVDTASAAQSVVLYGDESGNGQEHRIVDKGGAANTNNITIKVATGWNLNGSLNGTVTVSTAGAIKTCWIDGANKNWIVK